MTPKSASYRGDDKLLFGIILGVLAFWLCAQTTLNIALRTDTMQVPPANKIVTGFSNRAARLPASG